MRLKTTERVEAVVMLAGAVMDAVARPKGTKTAVAAEILVSGLAMQMALAVGYPRQRLLCAEHK
jgi:hypothetical protein